MSGLHVNQLTGELHQHARNAPHLDQRHRIFRQIWHFSKHREQQTTRTSLSQSSWHKFTTHRLTRDVSTGPWWLHLVRSFCTLDQRPWIRLINCVQERAQPRLLMACRAPRAELVECHLQPSADLRSVLNVPKHRCCHATGLADLGALDMQPFTCVKSAS